MGWYLPSPQPEHIKLWATFDTKIPEIAPLTVPYRPRGHKIQVDSATLPLESILEYLFEKKKKLV
jgi:hypothetical protein